MTLSPPMSGRSIGAIEYAAALYLAVPLVLFFAAYARADVAIASLIGIVAVVMRCGRLVTVGTINASLHSYLFAFAVLVVFSTGAFGVVYANSDWSKHYAIFHYLVDHSSLSQGSAASDGGTLRYYFGWYIVPALAAKVLGTSFLNVLIGAWTTIGLYLSFAIIADMGKRLVWQALAPLVFILFSGADVIGTAITGFQYGPAHHLEWWAGWLEYSSNYTDILWAPQHALPSWIGAALVLRLGSRRASLAVLPLVLAATVFWSTFAAIGLLPFVVFALARNLRSIEAADLLFGISLLPALIVLCKYLTYATGDIPFHPVWLDGCLAQGPSSSFPLSSLHAAAPGGAMAISG
jgi:hypothetical protein